MDKFESERPGNASATLLVLFLSLLAVLSIIGCQGEAPPPQTPQPQSDGSLPPPNEEPPKPVFSSSIEPLPEPNKYSVHLTWSDQGTAGLWHLSRKEPQGDLKELETLPHEKTDYEDTTVEAGKSYVYYLSTNGPNAESILTTPVTIPEDVQLSGVTHRSGEIRANRLFFDHGAHLVSDGKDLSLIANEIISDDGSVESFPEGQAAPVNMPGRDGGRILVQARTGKGTLHIRGRGESGGVGLLGSPGDRGKPGAPGRDGLSTHEKADVVCNHGDVAKRLRRNMNAGLPQAAIARIEFEALRQQHRCIQETGDGQRGRQGFPGGPGGTGANGGASAELMIQVDDPSSLQVDATANPGKGGRGGPWGVGGPGGPGGSPGNHALDPFLNCREASKGADGPQGRTGPSGESGEEGQQRSTCLKLGVVKLGSC